MEKCCLLRSLFLIIIYWYFLMPKYSPVLNVEFEISRENRK